MADTKELILSGEGYVTPSGDIVSAAEFATLVEVGLLNSIVEVMRGSASARVRRGDQGVVVGTDENLRDVRVLINRTNRHAWLAERDVNIIRLGSYRARKGEVTHA